MRHFYFSVVFWGEVFREYFLTLLVASLVAPGNIPALRNKKNSKLLVATTTEDWQAIQNDPLFQLLQSYIEVKFIDLGGTRNADHKLKRMSYGHQLTTQIMFRDRAIGVLLTPDLILSNGAVLALQRLVACGKKVVLCPAFRYGYSGSIETFKRLGLMQPGKPMIVSSRQIISVVLKLENFHSETRTWLWDDHFYAFNPIISLWKAPGEANYVMHGYSWAPLAVDYMALQEHDMQTLVSGTLDQDYIYRNFKIRDDIYVVTDSDELTLASFTKEEELQIPLLAEPAQDVPFIRRIIKKDNLRRLHYCSITALDPLKKKLILETIYLHSSDITPEWKKTVKKAHRFVKASIKKEPKSTIPIYLVCYYLVERYNSYIISFRMYKKRKISECNKALENIRLLLRGLLIYLIPVDEVHHEKKNVLESIVFHYTKDYLNILLWLLQRITDIIEEESLTTLIKKFFTITILLKKQSRAMTVLLKRKFRRGLKIRQQTLTRTYLVQQFTGEMLFCSTVFIIFFIFKRIVKKSESMLLEAAMMRKKQG